jgi:uncharacterized membrane protein
MTEKLSHQTLAETIIETTEKQKPDTVAQLVGIIRQKLPSLSEKEVLDAVIRLQSERKLRLMEKGALPTDLSTLRGSRLSLWYWPTVAIVLASIVSVFAIDENAYPLVVIRYVFGAIFVLWLPGYAFVKALYPTELPIKTRDKNLDLVERVALSAGMNLVLVPIVGLVLNYTPWGIRLTPIVLSLAALTLTFATTALLRETNARKQGQPGEPQKQF